MRCAIYTRKSADERVDSQLSTIENQRDLCEKYIASQAAEGWVAMARHYDDLGYSGGSLKRPALQQLVADIESGLIDVVVVYKIDRLSRSLRDFVELVDHFERRGVSFVAITQAFDTSSSMGRLSLNILLSFAQFERELTGERLRDWYAGARRRGLWTGRAPFGYDSTSKRLTINREQAEAVRLAFRRYPKVRSSRLIADLLNARGFLNREGRPWIAQTVNAMLNNRLYRGDLVYKGQVQMVGAFDPIVTEGQFRRAQEALAGSPKRKAGIRGSVIGLLSELLHGHRGRKLIHIAQRSQGRWYCYYVPSTVRYGVEAAPYDRYRAAQLEAAVSNWYAMATGRPLPADRAAAAGTLRRLIERVDAEEGLMTITLRAGGAFRVDHPAHIDVKLRPKSAPP